MRTEQAVEGRLRELRAWDKALDREVSQQPEGAASLISLSRTVRYIIIELEWVLGAKDQNELTIRGHRQ